MSQDIPPPPPSEFSAPPPPPPPSAGGSFGGDVPPPPPDIASMGASPGLPFPGAESLGAHPVAGIPGMPGPSQPEPEADARPSTSGQQGGGNTIMLWFGSIGIALAFMYGVLNFAASSMNELVVKTNSGSANNSIDAVLAQSNAIEGDVGRNRAEPKADVAQFRKASAEIAEVDDLRTPGAKLLTLKRLVGDHGVNAGAAVRHLTVFLPMRREFLLYPEKNGIPSTVAGGERANARALAIQLLGKIGNITAVRALGEEMQDQLRISVPVPGEWDWLCQHIRQSRTDAAARKIAELFTRNVRTAPPAAQNRIFKLLATDRLEFWAPPQRIYLIEQTHGLLREKQPAVTGEAADMVEDQLRRQKIELAYLLGGNHPDEANRAYAVLTENYGDRFGRDAKSWLAWAEGRQSAR